VVVEAEEEEAETLGIGIEGRKERRVRKKWKERNEL
jgi:hypothetical protein